MKKEIFHWVKSHKKSIKKKEIIFSCCDIGCIEPETYTYILHVLKKNIINPRQRFSMINICHFE